METKTSLYQVATASDGAHTLAVRHAHGLEFLQHFSTAPCHWVIPKKIMYYEVMFCCVFSYLRAFVNLAENLAVLFPINHHTLTSSISSQVFKMPQGA